jgi:hypothetical protein
LAGAAPQKMPAYVEEGRLALLELMGYLANFYRQYAWGFNVNPTTQNVPDKAEGKEEKDE